MPSVCVRASPTSTPTSPPRTFAQRLADGMVIGAEGYVFELERRGYVKAGPYVPEVVLDDAMRASAAVIVVSATTKSTPSSAAQPSCSSYWARTTSRSSSSRSSARASRWRPSPATRALGVDYIGICCGAGPHHVRAMAEALGRETPASRYSPALELHPVLGTPGEGDGPDHQQTMQGWSAGE